MTTLQAFGGRSFLCFPRPRLYQFFLLLIGICFSSLLPAQQVFTGDYLPDTIKTDAILKMPTDTIPDTVYIADCGLDIHFQSDMSHGGVLYKDTVDGRPRNSILTICPNNASNHLIFSFKHFDLEPGDTLCVYEGIVDHNLLSGSFGATPPVPGGTTTGGTTTGGTTTGGTTTGGTTTGGTTTGTPSTGSGSGAGSGTPLTGSGSGAGSGTPLTGSGSGVGTTTTGGTTTGTTTGGTTTGGTTTGGGGGTGATPPIFPATPILIAKHSGYGASTFNGGWVGANCDQLINTTGCLTFHFKTDGDQDKGTGWNAHLSCRDRTTTLMPPDNQFHSLSCTEVKKEITIGAGKILTTIDTTGINGHLALSDCTINNDTILVQIFNGAGVLCKDTCLRADSTFTIDTLAIGTYTVKHILKADTTIYAESYIALSPPVMVCNDDLNISLEAGCDVALAVDDILENPCPVLTPYTSYEIKVTMGSGYNKVEILGSTKITNTTSISDPIIWIPRDSIKKAGVSICDGNARVEIKRIYDYNETCCSQGVIEDVCWGSLSFQDKSGPIVYKLEKDTIKACNTDLYYLEKLLGRPTVIDNCDSASLELVEVDIVSGMKCDSISKYATTWKAEDSCGNQTLLRDTIYVIRPTPKDIVKLPDVLLSCGVDEEAAIRDLNITGVPKFALTNDTLVLSPDYYTCDFILIKRDEYVPHPGGIKLFRFWSLSDKCAASPVPIPVDTQLIEFVDTLLPTLICPANGRLATADKFKLEPFECTLSVSIDPPAAIDLCDPDPTVQMIVVEQLKHGRWDSIAPNLAAAGDLTADTFRVGWIAFDASHLHAKDTCHSYFILEDLTPPSAICKDQLNVSFGEGDPILTVNDIDDLSWDACGIAYREIRKTGDEYWEEQVLITCEDVYEPVRVELRVTDNTGNQNICWLFVNVLDNIAPICNELEEGIAYCDEFYTGDLGESTDYDGDGRMEESEWQPLTDSLLALYDYHFGYPTCDDNAACRILSIEQEYQLIYNQCGEADIRRRYRAIDRHQTSQFSYWEEQKISIIYRPNWKITLPADWTGECGDDLPAPGVTTDKGHCDILAWEHEDQVFDIIRDACYQVNRTYYIINWCTYEAGMEPIEIRRDENAFGAANQELTIDFDSYDNHGYYKYTQVLKINDYNKPVVTINPVQTCIYGDGDIATAINTSEGKEDNVPSNESFACDTIRVFSAEASDCESTFFKNFAFEWWVYEDGVQTGYGEAAKFFWTVQPKVDYRVRFRVYDNCGNFGEKEEHFQFWDCTQPTIVCQDTIVTSIRENGTALVSPAVIAADSYDNCSSLTELDYRIWHASFSEYSPDSLAYIQALPNALELSCTYLDLQKVQIYVLDGEANYSSCVTNIVIEDSGQHCGPSTVLPRTSIAGKIVMEDGTEVEEVAVQVSGMDNGISPYMTGTDGNFHFELDKGRTYNIQPTKNINPLNGVSTYDLVLISKHILEVEKLASPYYQIAADVNRSGQITAYDIVQLRQLILNITTEFPNNESWRFVDAAYVFDSDDPLTESFNEDISIDLDTRDITDQNFIAVKIGDVSGNALPNSLVPAESRSTSNTVMLYTAEQKVNKGQVFTITLQSDELSSIEGFQLALAFPDMELLEMTSGIVKESNVGWQLKDYGFLPISWNESSLDLSTNPLPIIDLTFKAQKDGYISELLTLAPKQLATEAYRYQELLSIELAFTNQQEVFELLQNRPNPFKESTIIGFHLPTDDEVTLRILSIDGKLLKEWTRTFQQGYNEWTLQSKEVNLTGVLHYQIRTSQQVATKKMVILE